MTKYSDSSQELSGLQKFMPLVGLGFWQAWWMCSSTTAVVNGPFYYGIGAVDWILYATLIGYAIIALLAHKFAPYSSRPHMFTFVGVGGFAGTLLISIATHTNLTLAVGMVLEASGAVILAFTNALLLLMWAERWVTLSEGSVGRHLVVSFAFAFVLYFLVSALPLIAGIILNAAFAAISAWALAISQSHPTRSDPVAPVELRPAPIAGVLVSIAVFSFAFGCIQRLVIPFTIHMQIQFYTMLIAFGCLVIMATIMLVKRSVSDPFTFAYPIVPALVCGMLICVMVSPENVFWGNGLVVFATYCLDMFMMFTAADLSYRSRKPVAILLGVAIIVARITSTFGMQLSFRWVLSPDIDIATIHIIVLVLACIVVLVGTALFTQPQLRAIFSPSSKPHVPDLDERCDMIGASAGLSARELEIMHYLARGTSFAKISEALGIAQGTVKHHASNTYRKLGVYDRQGLIELTMAEAETKKPPAAA
ncbi:MAG: helix-turn-helix transcriptional regulator [Coriobacteriales bacterium]|nr:helix-turn-helix transcriptional regulator [Coriobacteriales bacterium]